MSARVHEVPLRTRKKTPPDGYPRAFAVLGDRGGRSPERNRSWLVVARMQAFGAVASEACLSFVEARARADIALRARGVERFGEATSRIHVGIQGFGEVSRNGKSGSGLLWARKLHPSFTKSKHFFVRIRRADERRARIRVRMRGRWATRMRMLRDGFAQISRTFRESVCGAAIESRFTFDRAHCANDDRMSRKMPYTTMRGRPKSPTRVAVHCRDPMPFAFTASALCR